MEKLNLEKIQSTLPWKANGIYLEKNDKQVAAVCSSDEIADTLASCVNYYGQLNPASVTRINLYKKFIEAGYYLNLAIAKANIPVTTIEIQYVEKAYYEFSKILSELLSSENIKIESAD